MWIEGLMGITYPDKYQDNVIEQSSTGELDKTRFPIYDYTTTTNAKSVTIIEANPLEEPIILANFELIEGKLVKIH